MCYRLRWDRAGSSLFRLGPLDFNMKIVEHFRRNLMTSMVGGRLKGLS